MQLYKVLNGGRSTYQDFVWPLPKGKRPGKWLPKIKGELVACENGYHLCREKDILEWLGPEIYEAEHKGELVDAGPKVVVREARLIRKCDGWNETTARLYVADCAEHVLHIFEQERPDDDRPRKAIEAARAYARGEINAAAVAAARAATWDAAWAATWSTARDAAGAATWDAAVPVDAAWAAAGAAAAGSAAGDAARAAAGTAAGSTARAAARTAARTAAGAAARDAAWAATVAAAAGSAARDGAGAATVAAAGAAARDAVVNAAWAAAWADARAAEKEWQQKRLIQYLTGDA